MIKTKRVLSLLFALAMLVSVLGSGALAANYEPVSIAEGEPVTITWSGTEGAVVSVDGSGYDWLALHRLLQAGWRSIINGTERWGTQFCEPHLSAILSFFL